MAVNPNQIDTEAVNTSLDQEFISKFNGEWDRLAEILGLTTVQVVAAGTALFQNVVTGELNDDAPADGDDDEDSGSSGEGYVEGDLVALSKYEVDKHYIGTVDLIPYRKQVTAAAIQKSGYIPAVLLTDDKMVKQVRAKIITKFFELFDADGAKTATIPTSAKGTKGALAYIAATLEDELEKYGDATERPLFFVNQYDIAGYLANADVTTQTVFGMQYLSDFLGVQHIFVTNKVAQGTIYATPAENISVFASDFGALSQAGLAYTQAANGLIGVNHEAGFDRVSAYTNVLTGAFMYPEVANYIVKGTIR